MNPQTRWPLASYASSWATWPWSSYRNVHLTSRRCAIDSDSPRYVPMECFVVSRIWLSTASARRTCPDHPALTMRIDQGRCRTRWMDRAPIPFGTPSTLTYGLTYVEDSR